MGSTCCSRAQTIVVRAKADLNRAARKASCLDHPRYVEAANKAKADYIRAREDQMAHAEACAAAVSA